MNDSRQQFTVGSVCRTLLPVFLCSILLQTPAEAMAGKKASPGKGGADTVTVAQGWIDGNDFTAREVTFEDRNGWAMFEGDIVLGRTEDLVVPPEQRIVPYGVVITGDRYRWKNGIVPFVVDPAFSNRMQQHIQDAITHWQDNTAIEFVERDADNADEFPDFVQFTVADDVCSSAVGRQGNGMQNINLDNGRCSLGAVIHEIGHAVGLWHEQSREDRDEFVEIIWDNIEEGRESNFDQHISDGDDVGGYDYNSIMHYMRDAFSANGDDTIVPLDPDAVIGQRSSLSVGDRAAVASMYGPNVVDEATHWRYDSNGTSFFRNGFQRLGTNMAEYQSWLTGDFNGDHLDDIAQIYSRKGTQKVMLHSSADTLLDTRACWLGAQYSDANVWKSGDFNGDGLDDLLLVYGNDTDGASVWIYSSNGSGFSMTHTQGLGAGFWDGQRWETGDFNGDGLDDLVLIYGHSTYGATAWIYTSDGNGFSRTRTQRLDAEFWDSQRWETGDFNGDGMDDLVLVYGHSTEGATAWIYSSYGGGFSKTRSQRLDAGFWDSQRWEAGDFNGDGLDDLVLVYGHSTYGATAWTYSSYGSGFSKTHTQRLNAGFWNSQRWLAADLDGDGLDGVSLFYAHSE